MNDIDAALEWAEEYSTEKYPHPDITMAHLHTLAAEVRRLRARVKCFEDAGGVAMSTEIFHARSRAEAAEKERDELRAENVSLETERGQLLIECKTWRVKYENDTAELRERLKAVEEVADSEVERYKAAAQELMYRAEAAEALAEARKEYIDNLEEERDELRERLKQFECNNIECNYTVDILDSLSHAIMQTPACTLNAILCGASQEIQAQRHDFVCLKDRLKAAEESARRWDAIIGCARIRCLGSAGIVKPNDNGYAHIGVELWTHHDAASDQGDIEWLTKFADACIALAKYEGRK